MTPEQIERRRRERAEFHQRRRVLRGRPPRIPEPKPRADDARVLAVIESVYPEIVARARRVVANMADRCS